MIKSTIFRETYRVLKESYFKNDDALEVIYRKDDKYGYISKVEKCDYIYT